MNGARSVEVHARLALTVRGTVQGVGFRPFAWSIAKRLRLGGTIRNTTGAVVIEVEGTSDGLAAFIDALRCQAPPLARVETIERLELAPVGEREFTIVSSEATTAPPAPVAPDAATCAECVRELFDASNRRYCHAFVNCTNCGPRFSIVIAMPYDRATTTMGQFAMCAPCRSEYEDPSNRRFHAQPIACPSCGPKLVFSSRTNGQATGDPIAAAARAIASGAVLAVKGIGGYHLACDARNELAVGELRRRKQREAKPFAVMVPDLEAAEALAVLSPSERELLASTARPIVLVALRSDGAPSIAANVAPGLDRVGVMLPYTPVHHLLLASTRGPLVMTSGNVTDEPIAFRDDDAHTRLSSIASAFLDHDRPIHTRCDDSVAHVIAGAPAVLRRSRGYAPSSLPLASALACPTIALGGQLKAVFAMGKERDAVLGPHIGDLDQFEAWRSYREGLSHLQELLGTRPQRVVHDLHPDYATTAHAEELARSGLPRIAIQHHEAHVAACLEDAGIRGPALGVAFDGAGWGTDGAIWGGEVFIGTTAALQRAAHLRYVPLPGGDHAAREPWRMAVAHLLDVDVDPREVLSSKVVGDPELRLVTQLVERRIGAPLTSSMGRLFDAVAAILGLRERAHYEAHAAMALQCVAERADAAHDRETYSFTLRMAGDILEIDSRPILGAIVGEKRAGEPTGRVARRFHATVATMTAETCARLHGLYGGSTDVALSGGVFANALLARLTAERLAERGLLARFCRRIPTNDGGLAYGQLAVVAARDGSSS